MTMQEAAAREENMLLSEIVDNIAWITFNNPNRMNAMSQEMWDNSATLLDQYGKDNNVRAIVLKGGGNRAFVAGADISKFGSERASKEAMVSYDNSVAGFHSSLNAVAKPTIAQVNGYCIGGGLAIAIGCDIRVC